HNKTVKREELIIAQMTVEKLDKPDAEKSFSTQAAKAERNIRDRDVPAGYVPLTADAKVLRGVNVQARQHGSFWHPATIIDADQSRVSIRWTEWTGRVETVNREDILVPATSLKLTEDSEEAKELAARAKILANNAAEPPPKHVQVEDDTPLVIGAPLKHFEF